MSGTPKDNPKFASRLGAICFWIALWAVLAAYVGNDLLLAGPLATITAFCELLASPEFWMEVGLSGGRIVGSACASAVAGILLGVAAAHSHVLDSLLEIPMQIMKSAPVACVVVVLLVAFGSVGAIVIIVAFVALPPFYLASLGAAQEVHDDEARVLEIMGLSRTGVFLAHTWPSILPLYQHAAKTAVALSWRAGITGELLSIPLGSMGAGIYLSKLTLDTPALLAWTIVVMLLAFACELVVRWLLGLTASSPKFAVFLANRNRRSAGAGYPSTSADTPSVGADTLSVGADTLSVGADTLSVGAAFHAARSSSETVLVADALSKQYDGSLILDAVSLSLSPDDRICLMAPTGTGKTTLIRLLLGFEHPDSGSVSHPEECGVVFQQPTLVGTLSAWENVLLVADTQIPRDDMRAQLEALLPSGTIGKSASELSGGTKRLTEIARAVFSPGLCILLDEPFAGLDPASRERVCAFILKNLADRPLVIATHEKDDAALLNARIIDL